MNAHSGKESNISIEAKLDEIIEFIKTKPNRLFSSKDINDAFRKDGKFPYSLDLLISYLYNERRIINTGSGHQGEDAVTNYTLTLKGEQFIGYVKQKERDTIELRYKNWTTFALIFGGVAAGVYYTYQLLLPLLTWIGKCF